MIDRHLQLVGAADLSIDGINVVQLLSNLGEASAASSAVDLFGLCLSAQRVLERVHADAIGMSLDEAGLLAAFRKMEDRPRHNMLLAMHAMALQFPRRATAALTLVPVVRHARGDGQ